jgi:hypothetical protein
LSSIPAAPTAMTRAIKQATVNARITFLLSCQFFPQFQAAGICPTDSDGGLIRV